MLLVIITTPCTHNILNLNTPYTARCKVSFVVKLQEIHRNILPFNRKEDIIYKKHTNVSTDTG